MPDSLPQRRRSLTPEQIAAMPKNIPQAVALVEERDLYRWALEEIAKRPVVERNPEGVDQAAYSMRLIAQEALASVRAT